MTSQPSACERQAQIARWLQRQPTPVGGKYWVDRSALLQDIAALKQQVDDLPIQFAFPVKTFALAQVLHDFAQAGFNMDASNHPELELALASGTREVWLNGPIAAMEAFEDQRVVAIASSPVQLKTFLERGVQRIGLRIESTWLLENSPCDSRFGLSQADFRDCLTLLRAANRGVEILHAHDAVHPGTPAKYSALLRGLSLLASRAELAPRVLDVGGGQSSSCRDQEATCALVRRLCAQLPDGAILGLEMGDGHFQRGVFYSAPIVDIVERNSCFDVVVGGSLSACLQWSTHGVAMDAVAAAEGKPVRLCGATCHEGDSAGVLSGSRFRSLADGPKIGSPCVFIGVSPYSIGRSFAFNGIPKPKLSFL
jgi:diaminopimelate decarboxylase